MKVITIPCLLDNYSYLITDERTGEAAVVDPSEAWPVMQEIDKRKLNLKSVLCTHHHHDHIGGVEDLQDAYGDLKVFGFHQDQKRIPFLTELIEDNGNFRICGSQVTVLHTPGHTSTSIIFHTEDNIFVGDTLFGAGCGRLFEGTYEQMVHSIDRIISCGKDNKIYFGHEYTELNLRFADQVDPTNPAITRRTAQVKELRSKNIPSTPSTLEEELQTNPFLRLEDSAIAENLSNDGQLRGEGRIQVFTALRELRNNFS